MKRDGILNDRLSWILACLGHGDRIVVADCGLPIPPKVPRIDLALVKGVPSFQEAVRALAAELVIQRVVVAHEIRTVNPSQYAFLRSLFTDCPIEEVPHEEFKRLLAEVRAVVRTGEATPYANVILEAGVSF